MRGTGSHVTFWPWRGCIVPGRAGRPAHGGLAFPLVEVEVKIAILVKRFIQTGGAERIAVEMSRSLLKRGHDVHVYCQEMDTDACPGAVFHPIRRRIHKPTHLNAWCFAIETARLVKKEQYDIVHSFERGLWADIFYVTCICYRNWMWRDQSRAKRIFNYVKVAVDPRHMSYAILDRSNFERDSVIRRSSRHRG